MPAARRWILGSLVPCLLAFSATAHSQLLEVPDPASPPDQSTDIPLTLVLQWNPTASASSYDLQVSTSASFNRLVVNESALSDTFRQETLPSNGTLYYWRVRANYVLVSSQWSHFWTFTTIAEIPPAPALIGPPDGATSLPPTVKLLWHASMTGALYRVQVSRDTTFATVLQDQDNISDTSYVAASLPFSSKFFWRVLAKNGDQTSPWSDTWRFATAEDVPAAPLLASPPNGSAIQSLTVQLSWNPSATASRYRVQIATDAAFSNLAADDSSIAATSYSYGGLSQNTAYFWRVRAANGAGWSAWSAVWQFQTPGAPPAPALLAPPDGAGSQPLLTTLRWHTAANASSYDVQAGSDPAFMSTLVNDSALTDTFRQTGTLANGVTYWWRARARNSLGPGTWSAAWSFSTISQLPDAPSLVAPANGAADQPSSVTFRWNQSARASTYILEVSIDPSFSSTAVDTSLAQLSCVVGPLSYNMTFYWRVLAANDGGTSVWSAVWSFTTKPASTSGPVLLSPANNAVNQSTSPVLGWQALSGASRYHLQVSADPSFAQRLFDDSTLTATSQSLASLTNNTTYYWRVRGRFVASYSDWSDTWSFTTIPLPPGAPTLSTPANGATNVATSPVLTWNASTGASRYHVQVSTASSFTTLVAEDSSLTTTAKQLGGLAANTTFYWRVSASNAGGTSSWSTVWNFTTQPASTSGPVLLSPANNAVNQSTSPVLGWQALSGASQYHLQVSADPSFAQRLFDDSTLTATSQQLSSLTNNTTYYWRVRGKFVATYSDWSVVWAFTTIPLPPGVPTLSTPANGATNVVTSPVLTWKASPGASMYHVQVSTASSFTTLVAEDSTLTTTAKQLGGLAANTTFYWRVSASNAGGTSSWSTVWNFTTQPASTSGPVLLSPANGAVNQSTSPLLVWQAPSGTAEFHLQVSTDPSFGQRLFDDSTIMAASQQLSSLANNTTYYWRVRERFVASYSDWSSVWAFTTIALPPASPTLAAPANGATNVATSPVLTWNASTGASRYHVQVSTASSFTTLVAEDSSLTTTAKQLGGLAANTTFYWRVSASNAGGTSSWSTVWNFTTQPVSTSGPVLLSPSNNAVNQSTSPVLGWQALSGASRYHLQVSADPSFAQRLFDDSTLTATSQQLSSLTNSTTYYWRVRGKFVATYSDWSVVWAFTTIALPPVAPLLAAPANGATNVATSPVLTWNASTGASRYRVQVSTASSFTTLVAEDSTLTTTAKQLGGLAANTTFYWRVSASNAGGTSSWSTVWNFATLPAVPGAPLLVAPADGATDQPVSLSLTWNSVAGAGWYRAQISSNPSFTLLEADRDSIIGQSFTPSDLMRGSIHYWRVSAANQGGVGGWSAIRSFTTVPDPPPPPILSAPIERSTDRPTSLVLAWYPSAGAASYRVQLSNDSTFGVRTVDDSNVVGTSKPVQGLSNSTPYAWRVRGKNSGGAGNWSQTGHFSTQPSGTQSGPVLASPPDGSNNMPATVLMSWNMLAGATVYELQVSEKSDFSTTFYDNSSISSTSQSVGSLARSTTYFWRVRGALVALWSDWSTVWTFSTIPAVPPPPTLTSPADGATNQPRNIALSWNAISGATLYHLQCATNPGFTSLVADDSSLTSASRTVGPLALNTDYYWQVRAKNGGGWGQFSASRTFRTTQGLSPVVSTDQATGVSESTATIHATVNPNGLSTSVKFQYGTTMGYGSTVDAVPPTVSGETAVGVSYHLTGLNAGTTYHYRAVATSSAGAANGNDQTVSTQAAAYPPTVDVALSVAFPMHQNPSDYASSDYRIVGLPGSGNAEMNTFMHGAVGTDWQMYWDNGAPEGGFVQYDGGSNFVALPGRGYWLINRGAWSVQTSLAAAPIDSQRMCAVALHAGWNLITDPFTTPRAWGSVQQVNGVTEPLYAFHAGFSISDTLIPYEGYYFFNSTGLAQLKIPYDVQTIVAGKAGRRNEGGWALGIGAESRDGRDTGSEIGILADAGTAIPLPRYHKPRSFGMIPQVYFNRPEWDSLYSRFATDFHYSMQDAESWEMDVTASSGVPVKITFSGAVEIPSQYGVYLIDEGGHHVVDVRTSGAYTFLPRSVTTRLRLLVGTADATREQIRSVTRATAFSLGRNFPNPFNPSTTIPVEIPERSFVEVKVYDVLGQEIRTLFSGEMDQGSSAFVWDGKDLRGSAAPSGVYFCRLTTGSGFTTVQKMTLSK